MVSRWEKRGDEWVIIKEDQSVALSVGDVKELLRHLPDPLLDCATNLVLHHCVKETSWWFELYNAIQLFESEISITSEGQAALAEAECEQKS